MAWLSDWLYRKKITIQGQSGAGTDYQVLLKVGESSGALGYDFHVEGHSANFPSNTNQSGDLRFTKNDGTTLLNFWVEKVEGTSPNRVAYCWVKITDNLDNDVDIYCYYGNSNATNVSSVTNTFIREIGNLKASWHFDEGSGTTANDDSGNDNDGTLTNMTATDWVDGKFGEALNFDGSSKYVHVPNSDSLNITDALTIEAWIKPSTLEGVHRIVAKFGNPSGSWNGYSFQQVDSKLGAQAYKDNAGKDGEATSLTLTTDWNHVFYVFYNGEVTLYRNGDSEVISGYPSTIGIVSWDLQIGRHQTSGQYFNGIIDEVRIYNKALSSDEISDLYNNYGYTTTSYLGKVLVRKRIDPEPSFSSSFSEELGPGLILIDVHVLKCRLSYNYSIDTYLLKSQWLSNWNYRKRIIIQGQSGAGTDYQVLLKVGESSGALGYDFHVEGRSAIFPNDINQSGDLRFTKIDGTTLLNFWVEKVEGTSPNRVAYCWVKITDNLDNDVDIYCYYGNSNATNVSNGDNTFIFFDDFNDNNWTDKWTQGSSTFTINETDGVLDICGSGADFEYLETSDKVFSPGICLRVKMKDDTSYHYPCEFGFGYRNYGNVGGAPSDRAILRIICTADEWNHFATDAVGNESSSSCFGADNNYHVYDLTWETGKSKLYQDNSLKSTLTTNIPNSSEKLRLGHPETEASNSWRGVFDWLFVRKYISAEPEFSSASSEEHKEFCFYSIDLLLKRLRSFIYSCDVIIGKIEKIYNVDILLQKIKSFNYNINILLESLKSLTYTLDILIKKLKYINYNLDILLQKFDSINYNVDIVIEEITKKDYNTDILLKTFRQESYVSDILLQKLNSISYNTDLILNKIGESQYSIDLILQTEEEKSEYSSDVLLKEILNLNYQSDALLKLLKSIIYNVDVSLGKLQSLIYNINTVFSKLKSITYNNDALLEQSQSFNYDIDILLKQLSSSIYDINVLFKQLRVLTYNIDVIIKIIEKQIFIDVILSEINESKYSVDVSLFQRLRFAPCKLTLDYNKYNLNLDYNKYNLNLDFQCNEFNLDFACRRNKRYETN